MKVYVGIALRRGQADVSEKLLDGSEIGSPGQEVSGKRVPQGVGTRAMRQRDGLHSPGHDLPNTSICQSTPTKIDE